ncbi:hypothetical protein QOZ80_2BG0194330 [Eleusine coracana subsp. coracana]|nr:hypothetical protein QOZ80_2BG0194330 [Eleusine coracana subsp. coracana]
MHHLLVLFLELLIISLPSISGKATQVVYDTEGHELSSHSNYYILPAHHGTGTGGLLTYGDTRHDCTFFVVQTQNEGDKGIHMGFNPPSDGVVVLSSNVTINFHDLTVCQESLHWYVTNHSPMSSSEHYQYVGMGKGNTVGFPIIPPSVFRIERYGNASNEYKLVWCSNEKLCKDLGVHASMGLNFLVTSRSPLAVVFEKAL